MPTLVKSESGLPAPKTAGSAGLMGRGVGGGCRATLQGAPRTCWLGARGPPGRATGLGQQAGPRTQDSAPIPVDQLVFPVMMKIQLPQSLLRKR